MHPAIIVLIILVVVVLIFCGFYFSRKAIVKRALKKTPYKRIHEFTPGERGRVVGKIVYAGQVLQAPLSKRHCTAYHVEVQEYRSHGKSGSWVTVINEEKRGDIVIHDGMGYAFVEPQHLQTYYVQDVNLSSGTFNDATPELIEYMRLHGRDTTGLLGFNKSLRYKEGILEQHELVAVVGVGMWGSARGKNLNLTQDRVLIMSVDEKGKLYLSDDPDVTKTDNAQ